MSVVGELEGRHGGQASKQGAQVESAGERQVRKEGKRKDGEDEG